MSELTRALKNADPLRLEPSYLEQSRERILTTVLDADVPVVPVRGAGSRTRVLVVCTAVLLACAAIAYQIRFSSTNLLAAVRFEVRLADNEPQPGLTVAQVETTGGLVYLYPDTIIDNDDVAQAWVVDEGRDNRFGVTIQLLPHGAAKLQQATAGHLGKPLALLVDGGVVIAPTVRSPAGDIASITGDYTKAEAERIASGVIPR